MKNRIVALLLTVAVVTSMLPVTAFAAGEIYQLTAANGVTVDGTASETVQVYFQSIGAQNTYSLEADWSLKETSGTSYLTLTSLTAGAGATPTENSASTGRVYWTDTSYSNPVVTEAGGTVWTATYTVAADTPTGTYPVTLTGTATDSSYNTASFGTLTANISVTNTSGAAVSGSYTAQLSGSASEATVGSTVYVNVIVGGDDHTSFNAAELEISYTEEYLTFDSASSTLNGAAVEDSNGTLTLVDRGDAQTMGTAYTMAFTAKAKGAASVTLDSAAFGTAAEAESKNLIPATRGTTEVAVTVKNQPWNVTLPSIFQGNEKAVDGAAYTFSKAADGTYYDYTDVTATMAGSSCNVTDNGDGTWTIANVTGPLVISGNRTAKQFDVTITGDTEANDGEKATYNTPYTFTLADDKLPTTEAGYTYALDSVTIGGNPYTGYTKDDRTYTIPGTDITGAIEIVITKTDVAADQFTVNVTGTGTGDAAVVSPVKKGENAVLTLSKDPLYDYTVTATMGDGAATVVDNGNGTYTVSGVTANVVFTVTKTVVVTGVYNKEFVTLDGSEMWLITIGSAETKDDGKVYTYDGNNMFWSDEYQAFCWLEIGTAAPAVTADKFAIVTGSAVAVSYEKDVNKTGVVDANDAQLVYNIYNTGYSTFDTVDREKFLRADVNGSKTITVDDAAAIVDQILGN